MSTRTTPKIIPELKIAQQSLPLLGQFIEKSVAEKQTIFHIESKCLTAHRLTLNTNKLKTACHKLLKQGGYVRQRLKSMCAKNKLY